MTHFMKLNPEPFNMIQRGVKTIELRLYDEKRRSIQVGDLIEFTDTDNTDHHISATVTALHWFPSFAMLYENLPLLRCGYTEQTVGAASPEDMRTYYSAEQETQYGVVGIELSVEDFKQQGDFHMDTIQAIMSRTSTRDFLDKPIGEEDIRTILKAGMSGPSAVNARPWSFIVVRDREMLGKMADGNGAAAEPLRNAAFGILVCGDLERAFQRAPDFWIIDGAIAAQNMILAAHDLGIGNVWLGTWPVEDKVRAQAELFSLPESIIPHSIIAFGYPAPEQRRVRKPRPEWEEDRVHYERW